MLAWVILWNHTIKPLIPKIPRQKDSQEDKRMPDVPFILFGTHYVLLRLFQNDYTSLSKRKNSSKRKPYRS